VAVLRVQAAAASVFVYS